MWPAENGQGMKKQDQLRLKRRSSLLIDTAQMGSHRWNGQIQRFREVSGATAACNLQRYAFFSACQSEELGQNTLERWNIGPIQGN